MRLLNNFDKEYRFTFLDQEVSFWCYENDLLFLINYMTMVELHGTSYLNTFDKINDFYETNGNIRKLEIPINIMNHISNYLYIFEREKNIDSVLL